NPQMKRILLALAVLCAFAFATPLMAQEKAASPPATDAKATESKAETAPGKGEVAPGAPATPAAAPAAPTAPQLVAADKISSGDTAWLMTSTALVLMMTIPGLALFYGGMVRKKN